MNSDFIDLGLPSGTLWMSCNVGAETPEDSGTYYQSLDNICLDDNCVIPVCKDFEELFAHCTPTLLYQDGTEVPRINGTMRYDVIWDDEPQTDSTIIGMKMTSEINGNSILFPVSGYRGEDNSLGLVNECGFYWALSIDNNRKWFMMFSPSGAGTDYFYDAVKLPVRLIKRTII